MSVKLIEAVLCQTNPLSTLRNALDVSAEDYNSTSAHVLTSVLYSLNINNHWADMEFVKNFTQFTIFRLKVLHRKSA